MMFSNLTTLILKSCVNQQVVLTQLLPSTRQNCFIANYQTQKKKRMIFCSFIKNYSFAPDDEPFKTVGGTLLGARMYFIAECRIENDFQIVPPFFFDYLKRP